MKWMLENVAAVQEAASIGDAMFGTVDSWLIFNLTGGVDDGVHATDGVHPSSSQLDGVHRIMHPFDNLVYTRCKKCMKRDLVAVSNASRTCLMDLATLEWSEECAAKLGVSLKALPQIRSNSEVLGTVKAGPMAGVPIAGCLGDQQAALLGAYTLYPSVQFNIIMVWRSHIDPCHFLKRIMPLVCTSRFTDSALWHQRFEYVHILAPDVLLRLQGSVA